MFNNKSADSLANNFVVEAKPFVKYTFFHKNMNFTTKVQVSSFELYMQYSL